ncbi:MAG: class I SAM-dependent methyltransferase [Hyphomonadaceae bacterium]
MIARGPDIPEDLAKDHAAPRAGQTASQSAREIGAIWVKTFQNIGGLKAGQSVLDIGCGPGRMAIAIGEAFNWANPYCGFDVNSADIAFASAEISARWPAFRFTHMDLWNEHYNPRGKIKPAQAIFPMADGDADFAFATSVFTHMFRDEVERFIAEAHRCLKAGGTFLSTFFIRSPDVEEAIATRTARFQFAHRADDVTWFQNPKERGKAVAFARDYALQAFARAGFADVAHHPGAWSGAKGLHQQDVIVARKA